MQGRSSSDATQFHAFTLVELLVVISIVALLIGILLPVLGGARESAQRTVCASNQRQIGVAMVAYANDHAGAFPPYRNSQGPLADVVAEPIFLYRLGVADVSGPTDIEPSNHGLLHTGDYLPGPDVYYCPTQDGELWQPDIYENAWFSTASAGVSAIGEVSGSVFLMRSSYFYRPYKGENRFTDNRPYPTLDETPQDALLTMDLVLGSNYDTRAHDNLDGYNIQFADGHVAFNRQSEVAELSRNLFTLTWNQTELFINAIVNDPD
ncbi:MAG: DUF1559 domain-containing protein [Planctomycetota bacterium]